MQQAFDWLDAPVINCTGKDVPMPYAANLEKLALVTTDEVIEAVKKVTYRHEDETPIERRGDDFVLTLDGSDRRYRVVIPRELLDDEAGDDTDEAARRTWIAAHLPGVMSALTARETGGVVQEPWGRVMVEELP